MFQQSSTNVVLMVVAVVLFFLVGLRGFDEWAQAKQSTFTNPGSSTTPLNSPSGGTSTVPLSGNDPNMQLTDPGGMPSAFNNQIQIKLQK